MTACKGCGAPLPPSRGPRQRIWCSERCRKNKYDLECVDCGGRVSGTDPGYRNGRDPRCLPCASRKSGFEKRVWTEEAILAAIRTWADLYGEPPAARDWSPPRARFLNDEARARRFEDGFWPCVMTVFRRFGSWNAAISAAGFEPRAPVGTKENLSRRRRRVVAA